MNGWIITLIVISCLILLVFGYYLIIKGIELCKNNNSLGIVMLFIALNIVGLILGLCLLYNSKNGLYNKKEPIDPLEEKLKNKKSYYGVYKNKENLKQEKKGQLRPFSFKEQMLSTPTLIALWNGFEFTSFFNLS